MSQSDIPQRLCSTDEQPSLSVEVVEQPDPSESAPCNNSPLEPEQESSTYDAVARISELEHALDQALACLADFKWRIQNQEFLEAQLIKTEEFASVQHQAIACLKHQLQQREQALWLRDQMLLAIAGIANFSLLQSLEDALTPESADPLPSPDFPKQLTLPLDAEPSPDVALDATAQLGVAQQHIRDLTDHIAELEARLKQASTFLEERQVLELTLRQTKALATERDTTIAALRKELAIAQIKVEELETQLAKQHKLQAKWQQTCQELEQERDRSLTRMAALEQDATEMQEQIFQQARQASEYETAVQHWKDRYLSYQRQIAQLSALLEQALSIDPEQENNSSIPPELVELLSMLQQVCHHDTTEPAPLAAMPSPRFNKLDLPDFLLRRRSFRTR